MSTQAQSYGISFRLSQIYQPLCNCANMQQTLRQLLNKGARRINIFLCIKGYHYNTKHTLESNKEKIFRGHVITTLLKHLATQSKTLTNVQFLEKVETSSFLEGAIVVFGILDQKDTSMQDSYSKREFFTPYWYMRSFVQLAN